MQRITEIATGVFMFFVRFIKQFSIDLYRALYYEAMEFDSKLQETKTTTQRILIWTGIGIAFIAIILLLLHLLYRFLSTLVVVSG